MPQVSGPQPEPCTRNIELQLGSVSCQAEHLALCAEKPNDAGGDIESIASPHQQMHPVLRNKHHNSNVVGRYGQHCHVGIIAPSWAIAPKICLGPEQDPAMRRVGPQFEPPCSFRCICNHNCLLVPGLVLQTEEEILLELSASILCVFSPTWTVAMRRPSDDDVGLSHHICGQFEAVDACDWCLSAVVQPSQGDEVGG